MTNEIIVDVGDNQTRVAFLEDGELVELCMEQKEHKEIIGNIYKGRVENVLPGMRAAFIDIGLEKNAFLYLGDVLSDVAAQYGQESDFGSVDTQMLDINQIMRVGQEVVVQVIKGPIGTKGPRVTTNITLPGRALVLVPKADCVFISRRIDDEDEKQRLLSIAQSILPERMGLIVRTAAVGLQEQDFVRDIQALTKVWEGIEKRKKKTGTPGILHEDYNLTLKIVRDVLISDIDKLVINNRKQFEDILEFLSRMAPELKCKIQYFEENDDVFEHYGIKSQVDKALVRRIWLRCGGYLVIDLTEALTAIDVNTGKFVGKNTLEETILRTNMEAAEEIARQLRLRDIGGIIVIDFIDMHDEEHKHMVIQKLTDALKKDRTKTAVIGFTSLGLVEMTRKKVRENLSAMLNTDCPNCQGTGRVH